MAIDLDIEKFVSAVGGKEPSQNDENFAQWKSIFWRSSYFLVDGTFMIVKISRSQTPFWGVGRGFIELMNSLDNYFLVLLTSSYQGWVFTKSEVNANISSRRWKLREKDNNYKINSPLTVLGIHSSLLEVLGEES